MRIHILTPNRNHTGRNDYDGAFKLEAERLIDFRRRQDRDEIIWSKLDYGITIEEFNNQLILLCDWLVILCHGGTDWLYKSGFRTTSLRIPTARTITIFGCSAGADQDGPAAKFSQSGARWVDSHISAGHTTSNPQVARWVNGSEIGLISKIRNAQLYDKWTSALRDRHNNTLRFEYPLLSAEMIIERLKGVV